MFFFTIAAHYILCKWPAMESIAQYKSSNVWGCQWSRWFEEMQCCLTLGLTSRSALIFDGVQHASLFWPDCSCIPVEVNLLFKGRKACDGCPDAPLCSEMSLFWWLMHALASWFILRSDRRVALQISPIMSRSASLGNAGGSFRQTCPDFISSN